jgi:hypothetical protein
VRQSAWKNWVLLLQLALIGLLVVANVQLARKEPDVVLVTPEGRSTYLTRSVAGESLTQFLAEQRHQPTDTGILHFTREFLQLALAVNSSTIDEAWPQALSMMAADLRGRLTREAQAQRILETYHAAQVRTHLEVEDVLLVERTDSLLHVRATLARSKSNLMDGKATSRDRLTTDVVLHVVPRSPTRPDGLEVLEWRVEALSDPAASPPGNPVPAALSQEKSNAK